MHGTLKLPSPQMRADFEARHPIEGDQQEPSRLSTEWQPPLFLRLESDIPQPAQQPPSTAPAKRKRPPVTREPSSLRLN